MNATTTKSRPAAAATSVIQPYLFFDGRCDEAIEFYRRELGAEVIMLLRHKDNPAPPPPGVLPPGAEDKVMHGALRIGASTVLVSDGRCQGQAKFEGFALTLIVPGEAEARLRFSGLARGGKVGMPLEKTFFSPLFGMLTDKFGVLWNVYVAPAAA